LSVVVRTAIGVAIGVFVALVLERPTIGYIIVGVSVLIGLVSLSSAAARASLDRFFGRVGEAVGTGLSWLLLAPLFLVGFTAVRLWMRLTGADPLQLSPSARPSYWLESDRHERKTRYAGAMFATERLQTRRLSALAKLVLVLLAVVLSEGLLRLWGFGSPVLYVSDPQAGFYPAPNQIVDRYEGRIETNSFGMRSPQYSAKKPPNAFRILMIGDSTLYGGSYVDQEQLYSRQLEQHLRRAANGRPVEVLAIGVNAWGPFHKLGYIRKFGTFDADLAMINLPIEDIYRPLYGIGEVPFHKAGRPPRFAIEEVLGHLAWRYRESTTGPDSEQEQQWHSRQGLQGYAQLGQLLRAGGAEVTFQVLPTKPAGAMRSVPAAEARDVHRLSKAVAGWGSVSYPVGLFSHAGPEAYHDRVHLDVPGHRVYASFLRDQIFRKSGKWREWLAKERPASGARTNP
jgi:hypothetical protein